MRATEDTEYVDDEYDVDEEYDDDEDYDEYDEYDEAADYEEPEEPEPAAEGLERGREPGDRRAEIDADEADEAGRQNAADSAIG